MYTRVVTAYDCCWCYTVCGVVCDGGLVFRLRFSLCGEVVSACCASFVLLVGWTVLIALIAVCLGVVWFTT